MKLLIALTIWPLALAAIPAKSLVFGGQIYVWPFLLACCALVALVNWRAAMVLAIGVAGSQLIEARFDNPEKIQLGFYATLAFASLMFFDMIAAVSAALVSLLYFAAFAGIDWRTAMILSEVVIVAGLTLGTLDGPSGGILRPVDSGSISARAAVSSGVLVRRFSSHLVR